MEQQTDMGHLKHLDCEAKKCGLSVLSSPHCRASEHGFTFQLELPAILEMEGSNHYAKSPTQIDMAFMGPPGPPTERDKRAVAVPSLRLYEAYKRKTGMALIAMQPNVPDNAYVSHMKGMYVPFNIAYGSLIYH